MIVILDDSVPNCLSVDAGKYYLVDSGYANKQGYLAPYKGNKYHLQEFRDGPEPKVKRKSSIMRTLALEMLLSGHLEF